MTTTRHLMCNHIEGDKHDNECYFVVEDATLTVEIDIYKVDSRGVLPELMDISGMQQLLVDFIDNLDHVPVCTDEGDECNQHVTQMEDSEWRIGRLEVLRTEMDGIYTNKFIPTRQPYSV